MEMLEAVHLLLAVELFVVVVAIDPRWLLSAVAAHYRDVLHVPGTDLADHADVWVSSPAQYLEKIFQVVLTLPPVDDAGYARMLDSLIAIQSPNTTSPMEASGIPDPLAPTATTTEIPFAGATAAGTGACDEDLYGPAVESLPRVELTDPLTLTEEEARLLRLVGPPHLPLTPRSVKRLVNSYGLLTALRHPHREHDHDRRPNPVVPTAPATHYSPYRAGLVLLAALVAFPALGPDLCRHLHEQADTVPERSWASFLDELDPQRDVDHPGSYQNAARSGMHPAQAKQWADLQTALRQITETAAAHTLDLPARLGPWRPWVIPTARLSFPAGQVVKSLWHRTQQREADLHTELRNRLRLQPELTEASTYTSDAAKQHFGDEVLSQKCQVIADWLTDSEGHHLILHQVFDIPTGRRLTRSGLQHDALPVDVHAVRLVLERDSTESGYHVAYTSPAPDQEHDLEPPVGGSSSN